MTITDELVEVFRILPEYKLISNERKIRALYLLEKWVETELIALRATSTPKTQEECKCFCHHSDTWIHEQKNCPCHSLKPIEGIVVPNMDYGITKDFVDWMKQITTQTNLNTTAIENMENKI